MKTREVACEFYECEGSCSKGRAGFFRKTCQTCSKYVKKAGGQPARPNLRRKKLEDIRRKEDRY